MSDIYSITYSAGTSRRSNEFSAVTETWGNFVMRLMRHRRTAETMAAYDAMDAAARGEAKDTGGFVGGTFVGGIRRGDALKGRTLITLDLDRGTYDPAEVLRRVHTTLGGVAVAGYSSHSHRPEAPRIRLVIPLARTLDAAQYREAAQDVIERCSLSEYADECSLRPAQLFYWPSASADAPVWAAQLYGPQHDPGRGARPASPEPGLWDGAALGDPRDKPGLIGAFCRAYHPISRAIEELLGGVYIKRAPGRYRYVHSDSEAGLIVRDGGLHAYSNHTNTDPAADGHCHNAYDLVRIHLCGGDDEAMRRLCMGDEAVRRENMGAFALIAGDDADDPQPTAMTDATEATADRPIAAPTGMPSPGTLTPGEITALPDWDVKKDGSARSTGRNAHLIFRLDSRLWGQISYDTFRNMTMAGTRLPWFRRTHPRCRERQPWNNNDDAALIEYASLNYAYDGADKLKNLMNSIQTYHNIHPVRDYLKSLQWDGTPRLETMIIEHLGADDDPTTREMTRLLMVGAVARVMQPGVKFDYMTILQGPQGCYKSTLCRVLFSPWYLDNLDLSDKGKDSSDLLRGRWGVEMSELAGMNRSGMDVVKAFITRQSDVYRAAYARLTEEYPRQCVFLGTVNDECFLKDDENRRFNVIRIDPSLRRHDDPSVSLAEVKDQLWAEAYHLYRTEWKERPLVLSAEAREVQRRRNEEVHMSRMDPVFADLEDYISITVPADWDSYSTDSRRRFVQSGRQLEEGQRGYIRPDFSLKAFLWEMYGYSSLAEAKQRNKALGGDLGKRIAGYLRRLGKWTDRIQKRTAYGREWVYERLDNPYIEEVDDEDL